jgi:hypothetical protein
MVCWLVNDELKRIWKGVAGYKFWAVNPEIVLETKEDTQIVSHYGLEWRDLNHGPSEYEAWVKITRPWRPFWKCWSDVTSLDLHFETHTEYSFSLCRPLEIVKYFENTIVGHLNWTYKYGTAQFTNIPYLNISLFHHSSHRPREFKGWLSRGDPART